MFISPMLLQELDSPTEDYANVITELKLDGIRLVYSNLNGKPKLYTRFNQDVTFLFPEICSTSLPKGIILDGELISPDFENEPNFLLLLERFKSKKAMTRVPVQYVAFDILYYKGRKVTQFALRKRKDLLNLVIPTDTVTIVSSQWVEGNAKSYFEVVKEYNLEGIVMKKPQSKYHIGKRTNDWSKVLNYNYRKEKQTAIINKSNVLLFENKSYHLHFLEFQSTKNRRKLYETYRQFLNKKMM
ncbi:ATP-dependent DNA ligase [Halalkalibacter lacteus]|uniref:ATP-dependent DNA ligase n=1 Tax=Halalkalibacter lacteus TaxID=3090663 RepID=UPI002FCAA737